MQYFMGGRKNQNPPQPTGSQGSDPFARNGSKVDRDPRAQNFVNPTLSSGQTNSSANIGGVPNLNVNRNVNKKRNSVDRGGLSPRSQTAKLRLESYEQTLNSFKARLEQFSQHLGTDVSHSDLTHMKNELAQLNGTLEKLQFNEIDSIVTADLITGKDEVKAKRKTLNTECERVRQNINEVNGVVTALLVDGK